MDNAILDLSDRVDTIAQKRRGFLVNACGSNVCTFARGGEVFIIAVFTGTAKIMLGSRRVYDGSSPALLSLTVSGGDKLTQDGGSGFRAILLGDVSRSDSLRLTGDANPYFALIGDTVTVYSLDSSGAVSESPLEAYSGAKYIDFSTDGESTAIAYVDELGTSHLAIIKGGAETDSVTLGAYKTVSVSLSGGVAAVTGYTGQRAEGTAFAITEGGLLEVSSAEDIGAGEAVLVKGDPYTVFQNIGGEIFRKTAMPIVFGGVFTATPLILARE